MFDAALKYLQTPGGKWIGSFPGVAVQERITISHDFAALLLSRGDSESNTVKGGFHQFPRNKNACSLTPSCASFPADVSENLVIGCAWRKLCFRLSCDEVRLYHDTSDRIGLCSIYYHVLSCSVCMTSGFKTGIVLTGVTYIVSSSDSKP